MADFFAFLVSPLKFSVINRPSDDPVEGCGIIKINLFDRLLGHGLGCRRLIGFEIRSK